MAELGTELARRTRIPGGRCVVIVDVVIARKTLSVERVGSLTRGAQPRLSLKPPWCRANRQRRQAAFSPSSFCCCNAVPAALTPQHCLHNAVPAPESQQSPPSPHSVILTTLFRQVHLNRTIPACPTILTALFPQLCSHSGDLHLSF